MTDGDDVVAGAYACRGQRQMKGGWAVPLDTAHAWGAPTAAANAGFESLDFRTLRDPAGEDGPPGSRNFSLVHLRT